MIRHKGISRSAGLRSYAVQTVSQKLPHLAPQAIADRLSYGSFVSLEHKIVYFETPKAGCTAVKEFLRDLCGAPQIKLDIGPQWETRRDMFVHVRANVPLPSLLDLDDRTQERVLSDPAFLRFAIVRNPYTRLVSAWRNKIMPCEPGYEYVYRRILGEIPPVRDKRILSFEQFLGFVEAEPNLGSCNPHWRRQVDLLLHPAISYTHIGQLERLQETIALIEKQTSRNTPVVIHKRNSADPSGSVSPIDESLANRIQRLYTADFDAFGYVRESWRRTTKEAREDSHISQARFLDEIIERNLIISHLYQAHAQLESRYRRVSRLSAAGAIYAIGRLWKRRRPRRD